MSETPRTLATSLEKAAATEENLVALFGDMRILEGYESAVVHGVPVHHAWPTNPMFKGAAQFAKPTDASSEVVGAVVSWFAQRDAPFHFWWFNSESRSAALEAALGAAGFTLDFDSDPAMVAHLHELNVIAPGSAVSIELADTRESLEAWRDVFRASYDIPLFAAQAWVDATLHLGGSAPWSLYVARLNGQPVGTSMLYCGAGVAGLFAVGTLPSARGSGIGRAVTQAPLLDARSRGYTHGVLFASPMGQSVYARMGFEDTGRRLGRYVRVGARG